MTNVGSPALLLDTYSLFFRAYHALPDMRTTAGEPTAATYGFLALLLKLLRERRPMSIAFALDVKEETFRRRRYTEYKAGRDAVPDLLLAQLARLHELLSLLEVPVHYAPGYEADDVLATLARELRERQEPALVVSGDRDLLQLAHGSVKVLFAGARGKDAVLYGAAEVEARFGVPPQALPSWVALVGDPSDNLPKVPGIGPRTATQLVRQFGNMDGLLARLSEVTAPRLRGDLERHREQIVMTEQLARLVDHVPLAAEPRTLALSPRSFQQLHALFVELEFHSLLPRLAALAPKELI